MINNIGKLLSNTPVSTIRPQCSIQDRDTLKKVQKKTACSTPFLLGSVGGGPQIGEVTHLGGVTHLSTWSFILIWSCLNDSWGDHMRDYMDRWITSPSWGPPPPCKQALRICQALIQARVSAKNDIIWDETEKSGGQVVQIWIKITQG